MQPIREAMTTAGDVDPQTQIAGGLTSKTSREQSGVL